MSCAGCELASSSSGSRDVSKNGPEQASAYSAVCGSSRVGVDAAVQGSNPELSAVSATAEPVEQIISVYEAGEPGR